MMMAVVFLVRHMGRKFSRLRAGHMRVEFFNRHELFTAHGAIADRSFRRWPWCVLPPVTFEADTLLVRSYESGALELFVPHWDPL
jgi:hypothetical protein